MKKFKEMSKEHDVDLILPQEVFKRNQIETLKRNAQRRRKAEIKGWIRATIQAPVVIALFYFIYCLMYVVIGG